MGQTCSTVQQSVDRNSLKVQSNVSQNAQIKTQVKQYLSKQKLKIDKITFIQNSQELIYQFNDPNETVKKLKVQHWNKQDIFKEIIIQEFINQRQFIVRVKAHGYDNYLWRLFSTTTVKNIYSQNINDFGIFYYNFSSLKLNSTLNNSFIYADQCFVNFQNNQTNKATFIIQSQIFTNDIVSLKQLGRYMNKNEIYWQDKQFVQIICKCYKQIQKMHQNHYLLFEEFLLDKENQVYCIGSLIQQNENVLNQKSQDIYSLTIYLFETLYGKQLKIKSIQQLSKLIQEQESKSKFDHTQSLQMLWSMHKYWELPIIKSKVEFKAETTNIADYIESYRAKKTLQPTYLLSQRYIDLNQFYKAKQILFQRLSILLYHQKDQLNKQNTTNEIFIKLIQKLKISKSQLQQCFQVIQQIIHLERKILKFGSLQNQLHILIKQYINLAIILSFNSRKNQNFTKSLSILQRVQQFVGQNDQSWLLSLHLGQCYLLAGNLEEAQKSFKKSIKFQINEANICFFIKFYTTVLNWENSISLLRTYEGLILNDYIYDLLIAKILLSKALCLSTKLKQAQDERSQIFYESRTIARKTFSRKNISQAILCEAYEIIGDCHFYSKEYELALESYDKGLALSRSINYTTKQSIHSQQGTKYEPKYIKQNQQEYTRIYKSQMQYSSSFKNAISLKSVNQTLISFASIDPQNQSVLTSYIYQLQLLYNFDKTAILLSSIANCKFLQRKYAEAITTYEEARNLIQSHNLDLKNSIIGNMAICSMQMGKNDINNQVKLQQGKNLLQHIINVTKKQNPFKLQNNINYIFLVNQLQSQ